MMSGGKGEGSFSISYWVTVGVILGSNVCFEEMQEVKSVSSISASSFVYCVILNKFFLIYLLIVTNQEGHLFGSLHLQISILLVGIFFVFLKLHQLLQVS